MARCSRCVVQMKKLSAGHFVCRQCGGHRHEKPPAHEPGAPLPVEDITLTSSRRLRGVVQDETKPHQMNWLHT